MDRQKDWRTQRDPLLLRNGASKGWKCEFGHKHTLTHTQLKEWVQIRVRPSGSAARREKIHKQLVQPGTDYCDYCRQRNTRGTFQDLEQFLENQEHKWQLRWDRDTNCWCFHQKKDWQIKKKVREERQKGVEWQLFHSLSNSWWCHHVSRLSPIQTYAQGLTSVMAAVDVTLSLFLLKETATCILSSLATKTPIL